MAKKNAAQDRRARAAQIQAEHRRAERRRGVLIVGASATVGLLIVGGAVLGVRDQAQKDAAVEAAAKQPIEGVEEFPDLSRNHVEQVVDYPQMPSVGGDHSPVWTNCGVYDSPVDPMQTTHSLEHGAVWVGYDPDLAQADVDRLSDLANTNSYVVLSPVAGGPAPITASAWGVQLGVDTADDQRLQTFLQKYQQGPQAPEPGAPCTGGVGGMG
jgi:hypothetical protein